MNYILLDTIYIQIITHLCNSDTQFTCRRSAVPYILRTQRTLSAHLHASVPASPAILANTDGFCIIFGRHKSYRGRSSVSVSFMFKTWVHRKNTEPESYNGIWQTWPKLKDVRLLWMWMQSQSALLNSAHSAEYRHAVMAQWFIAIQPTHNASLHTEIIKSAASRFDLNRHFLSNWLYSLFISITISFVRLLCCFQSAPFSDLGHTAVVRICFAAFQCEAINVNCHLKWVRPRPLQSLWMFGQFRWLRMSERPRDDKYTFLTGEIFLAVTNGNQIKTSIRHFCRSFVGGTLGLSRCLWVARSDYSSTIFIELA